MADDNPGETSKASNLGAFIAKARLDRNMSLRDVEEATGNEVSNAYLSQLERGKITKPSPHMLHALSGALGVSYESLMMRAGYIVPTAERLAGTKHGRAATYAIENLSADEEGELLKYLKFIRSQRTKKK